MSKSKNKDENNSQVFDFDKLQVDQIYKKDVIFYKKTNCSADQCPVVFAKPLLPPGHKVAKGAQNKSLKIIKRTSPPIVGIPPSDKPVKGAQKKSLKIIKRTPPPILVIPPEAEIQIKAPIHQTYTAVDPLSHLQVNSFSSSPLNLSLIPAALVLATVLSVRSIFGVNFFLHKKKNKKSNKKKNKKNTTSTFLYV